MKAKLLKISNNSASITYVDEQGVPQACVIDAKLLPTRRVGHVFELVPSMLIGATPYGIDMEIVYPDGISIDAMEFHKRLYESGIVSLSDLKRNPSAINQVLISMLPAIAADIYKHIKIVMEDYNDRV